MNPVLKFLLAFLLFAQIACAQVAPPNRPYCDNEAFDEKVSSLLRFSVPVIGCDDLKKMQADAIVFDTREKEEYEISHIEGAELLGYNKLDLDQLKDLPKDTTIIVYCSVGYRSEKVGEKLKAQGFENVYNLYGSIFEWVNEGNPVVDKTGKTTGQVHTYNKRWSQWVEEGKAVKIW